MMSLRLLGPFWVWCFSMFHVTYSNANYSLDDLVGVREDRVVLLCKAFALGPKD